MVGRIIVVVVIVAIIVVCLLVAAYKYAKAKTAGSVRPERDISATPGAWYTYSRVVGDTRTEHSRPQTEIGIQYVTSEDKAILERRALKVIFNDSLHYSTDLDAAQDEAYAAQRVANLGLIRR